MLFIIFCVKLQIKSVPSNPMSPSPLTLQFYIVHLSGSHFCIKPIQQKKEVGAMGNTSKSDFSIFTSAPSSKPLGLQSLWPQGRSLIAYQL